VKIVVDLVGGMWIMTTYQPFAGLNKVMT